MPNLHNWPDEFKDFTLDVAVEGKNIRVLCCPEDIECDITAVNSDHSPCARCSFPLCSECAVPLKSKRMPPAALSNDMMVFYAPVELYSLNVTVVEMVCASVCITSMICTTLEMKHRNENPFDSTVHMASHRMGARGNATSFPLPWSSLLAELQRLEVEDDASKSPDLPWTGSELSDKISVLIKTHEEYDTLSMAQFVHQALVRRDVVLQLIQGAKSRGHRAYANVDMKKATHKAQSLPENGVPPELVRVLPYDDHLDKVLVQKAATPVSGRSNLEGAGWELATSKPNAVVLEKSSYDETDINAQRIRVLHHYAEALNATIPQSIDDAAAATRPQMNAAKKKGVSLSLRSLGAMARLMAIMTWIPRLVVDSAFRSTLRQPATTWLTSSTLGTSELLSRFSSSFAQACLMFQNSLRSKDIVGLPMLLGWSRRCG